MGRGFASQDCETGETPIEAIGGQVIEHCFIDAAGGRSRERSEPSRHIAKEIAYDRLRNGIRLLREQSVTSGFDDRGCHAVTKFGPAALPARPTTEATYGGVLRSLSPTRINDGRRILLSRPMHPNWNLAPSRRTDVKMHVKYRLCEPFKMIGASLRLQSVSESGSARCPPR